MHSHTPRPRPRPRSITIHAQCMRVLCDLPRSTLSAQQCRRSHERDPQGTRQNATSCSLDASSCGKRSTLARAARNLEKYLRGTAHAPRVPRPTPPITPRLAPCISSITPYWLLPPKCQIRGCGTASLQYPTDCTPTRTPGVENAIAASMHQPFLPPQPLQSSSHLPGFTDVIGPGKGFQSCCGVLMAHFGSCKVVLCDESDDRAVLDGDLLDPGAYRT